MQTVTTSLYSMGGINKKDVVILEDVIEKFRVDLLSFDGMQIYFLVFNQELPRIRFYYSGLFPICSPRMLQEQLM